MKQKLKKVIVLVPHRISGFFEIVDEVNGEKLTNPVRIGSRGAGFNLTGFGKTEIEVTDNAKEDQTQCKIFINDQEMNEKAETSYYIYEYILNFIKTPTNIVIKHNFDLPVGCGYGASGSGALGTVFGLDHLFNLNLRPTEKGKIAHISEVINKTGLGTICGQLGGGLCILKEPGYPCVHERIKIPPKLRIVCGSFGEIPTKSILTNPVLNRKIKEAGKYALEKLLMDLSIKTFMDASFEFVTSTNILELLDLNNTKELLDDLNGLNIIGASMNQLGRSVYAVCRKNMVNDILPIFESYKPKIIINEYGINEGNPIRINPE